MSKWRTSTWGDEIILEYGKALRGYNTTQGQYRVYGSNGAIGWTSKSLTNGPGIILGRKGAYRGVQYSSAPFFVIDTAYYVVPKTNLHMRWLYYAIKHHKLGEIDDGSPIPSTTRAAVYVRDIEIPPIEEQRSIAHTLGSLDDKIELNRRTNETLEAMARALFKDWFIDYGPVHAKMEGREPYLAPEIWDLFPDSFDEENRPEGWSMVALSELVELNPTEKLKKSEVAPYVDMASLPTSGTWSAPPIDRAFGSGMKFRNGDTLLARITPCLENGKTALVQNLPENKVGWGSTEFIVMRPKGCVPPEYAYLLARNPAFREHAIRSMTGTSGRQRAQASVIAAYPVINVPDSLWLAFGETIGPWFDTIKSNAEESEILAQTRDLLLPKLLSDKLTELCSNCTSPAIGYAEHIL